MKHFIIILGLSMVFSQAGSPVGHVSAMNDRPKTEKEWLFDTIDSVAKAYDVPPSVMMAVAKNESGFKWVVGSYGDMGYFQIIPSTYAYLYKRVRPKRDTFTNNVILAGYYLSTLHKKYGSWTKARYAYGRGHWKSPDTWTAMENKFMSNFKRDYELFNQLHTNR